MRSDPILSRLGLARRAGLISTGYSASADAVKAGKSRLVVVASDISPKTEKEIRFVCKSGVTVSRICHNIEAVSAAIGTRAGVISVNDQGFAEALTRLIKEECQNDD